MITREEYLELKELYNDGYRWIARDSCEIIYAYKLEPIKLGFSWKYSKNNTAITCGDDFLLPYVYIKWEDEKPTKILDLIQDYEKHEELKGKVVIPQFVADWIEEVKGLKRNFKLEYLFDTTEMPDDVYNCLTEWYEETDILTRARLGGLIVSEDERLYYALIKGHELSSNEFKYWGCNTCNSGDLFIGSKHPKGIYINRMTKNNWNKLGINNSNADFVVE